MEYKIVSHVKRQDTEDEVNAFLSEGWELHGDLKVDGGPPNGFTQAMVKRGDYETGATYHNVSVEIDNLEDIKYALEKIAEAVDDVGTNMAHVAHAIGGKLSDVLLHDFDDIP